MARSEIEMIPPPIPPAGERSSFLRPEHSTLRERTTSFKRAQLREVGLEEIAELVSERVPLTIEQARFLAKAPFSALVALSECVEPLSPARLRPMYYVPVSEIIRQSGSTRALQTLRARTDAVLDHLTTAPLIALAIDEWGDANSYKKVFETLTIFSETKPFGIEIIGPSTAELRNLAATDDENELARICSAEFFAELRRAGVTTIEGGSNRTLHGLAAANGFQLLVAQNLVRSRTTDGADGTLNEAFLQDVFAVREQLLPTGSLQCWLPWSSAVLDTGLPRAGTPLGLEFLRALVVGKLLLPEVPFVRASVTLVGIRLAELAYSLGVNDFGYVSADAETAERLGLLPLSQAVSEFQVPHLLSAGATLRISTSV